MNTMYGPPFRSGCTKIMNKLDVCKCLILSDWRPLKLAALCPRTGLAVKHLAWIRWLQNTVCDASNDVYASNLSYGTKFRIIVGNQLNVTSLCYVCSQHKSISTLCSYVNKCIFHIITFFYIILYGMQFEFVLFTCWFSYNYIYIYI